MVARTGEILSILTWKPSPQMPWQNSNKYHLPKRLKTGWSLMWWRCLWSLTWIPDMPLRTTIIRFTMISWHKGEKKKYDACKKDTICSTKTPEDIAFIIIRTSALIEYRQESKLGIIPGKQTFLKGTCAKFPQLLSWLARFIVLIISDYVKLLNTLRKTKLKKK